MNSLIQIVNKVIETKEMISREKAVITGDDRLRIDGLEMYIDSLLEWIAEEEDKIQ